MNVGAFVVPVKGTTATTTFTNIMRNINSRTRAVFLASPAPNGERWSARQIAALARMLPKHVVLVLDLNDAYCLSTDMFNVRGLNLGPNVIVVPQLWRPRMFACINRNFNKRAHTLKLVESINKFIGDQAALDVVPEAVKRRAAFNLFWTTKMACKLAQRKRTSCTTGPDGAIVRFTKVMPTSLIQDYLSWRQAPTGRHVERSIDVNLACSRLYEALISALSLLGEAEVALSSRELSKPNAYARVWRLTPNDAEIEDEDETSDDVGEE